MSPQDTFTLTLDGFRGPLELLLDLIEKQKMQVNDISLSRVADEYISYLNNRDRVPLSQTAHFVVIAATLLLIKSRSLLPHMELTHEDEEDIRNLEYRLGQYRHVRAGSRILRNRWHKKSFLPLHQHIQPIVCTPAPDVTTENLSHVAHRIISALPSLTHTPTVRVAPTVSLNEVIERLTHHIRTMGSGSFTAITSKTERVEAIVHFLALLELIRGGILEATQYDNFSDILIEYEEVTTPHYD